MRRRIGAGGLGSLQESLAFSWLMLLQFNVETHSLFVHEPFEGDLKESGNVFVFALLNH